MSSSKSGWLVKHMTTRSRQRGRRVLAAGYVTLDLIVRDLENKDFWQSPGGTAANVSTIVRYFGYPATVVARVAPDHRGDELVRALDHHDVDISMIERESAAETPAIVELLNGRAPGAHRFSYRCPACGRRLPKIMTATRQQARAAVRCAPEFALFFFDRATTATIDIAAAFRKSGQIVVFEPTRLPATHTARLAADLSDVVKIARQRDRPSVSNWLPSSGSSTRCIIETLDREGLRFRWREGSGSWLPWQYRSAIEPSNVRDSAGAGDWFTAGMIQKILAGTVGNALRMETIEEGISYGQALGALSLSFDGPIGLLAAAVPASDIRRVARAAEKGGKVSPRSVRRLTTRTGRAVASTLKRVSCSLCLADERR